jgi:predicted transcriptional regulator
VTYAVSDIRDCAVRWSCSPDGYWHRYGLPNDYPMAAPAYAAQCSAVAKAIGLGCPGARQPQEESAEEAPA